MDDLPKVIKIQAILLVITFLVSASLIYGHLKGWYELRYVEGISMEPTFFEGDLTINVPVTTEELELGTVVSFPTPGGDEAIHRIVGTTESGCFLTKGDNNPVNDLEPTCKVSGRVIARIPRVGNISKFLRDFFQS